MIACKVRPCVQNAVGDKIKLRSIPREKRHLFLIKHQDGVGPRGGMEGLEEGIDIVEGGRWLCVCVCGCVGGREGAGPFKVAVEVKDVGAAFGRAGFELCVCVCIKEHVMRRRKA
jgi:hypothetical protein